MFCVASSYINDSLVKRIENNNIFGSNLVNCCVLFHTPELRYKLFSEMAIELGKGLKLR